MSIIAYRGYRIVLKLSGDYVVVKDGTTICHADTVADARRQIDLVTSD